MAKTQVKQGVDVIYAVAGQTNFSVLKVANDAGILAIGVDLNQNALHPGSVLTSMLKRVDVAVYDTFVDAAAGRLSGGLHFLGLKEGGVDYAMDDNNKAMITPEMTAAVDKAKADIIAGTIEVHDFMADNKCPY